MCKLTCNDDNDYSVEIDNEETPETDIQFE